MYLVFMCIGAFYGYVICCFIATKLGEIWIKNALYIYGSHFDAKYSLSLSV